MIQSTKTLLNTRCKQGLRCIVYLLPLYHFAYQLLQVTFNSSIFFKFLIPKPIQKGSKAIPHLATILKNTVCEATVALRSDFHIIGSLEQKSFLQVSSGLVHIGNAVLAVVCEVLRGLCGQQSQERHLNTCCIRSQIVVSIAKLWR